MLDGDGLRRVILLPAMSHSLVVPAEKKKENKKRKKTDGSIGPRRHSRRTASDGGERGEKARKGKQTGRNERHA